MTKDEGRAGLEALRNQLLASGVPCAALGAFEDEIRAEAAEKSVEWIISTYGAYLANHHMIPDDVGLRAAITRKEPTK